MSMSIDIVMGVIIGGTGAVLVMYLFLLAVMSR